VKSVDGVASAFVGESPAAPPKVVDGNVIIQATLTPAADSLAAETVVENLRTTVHKIGPDVLVGGTTAVNYDVRQASERDLRVDIPAILAVVFIVLMLLLRSLVAPVVLVLANVLSFAATLGVSALVFNHVFGFPGSDPATPLYAFVFLVALGVDYSIFLMTRVKEESAERGTRPGILVALAVTGGVITSAGIVLAATFSALAIIPILFLAQIAFIVAFGVLLDTTVVRSLLVPAVSYEIGRRLWWPSGLDQKAPQPEDEPAQVP
jgi:RND superfamily putative drug exporter